MKAHYRKVRISPKKANLIASMVRGEMATNAMHLLKYMPKKGARVLGHLVKSAVANAQNNFGQDADQLVISKIIVNKGPVYKRAIPISRGRTHPIQKRTSNILVEVNISESEEQPKKEKTSTTQSKDKKPTIEVRGKVHKTEDSKADAKAEAKDTKK